MNLRLALLGGLAALVLVAGCAGKDTPPASDTATFDAFVQAAARKAPNELNPQELEAAIEQFVGLKVAGATAGKTGLDKDPEVAAQLTLNRLNVLTENLLRKFLDEKPITDAEIQAEYDEQAAKVPAEYRARHILVDDESLAKGIIEKLKAGGDFAAQAKEFSKDGSAQNGGDLGWFNLQSMVKEFSDAVAALKKGEISRAPVKTQYGWHVIKLEDTRAPSLPPLNQVKDQVKQLVQNKKLKEHLISLREGSGINAEQLTAALKAHAEKPAVQAPAADATAAPAAPAEGAAATP
jgi:peptidyl-prolyl cis-trans isomerase C